MAILPGNMIAGKNSVTTYTKILIVAKDYEELIINVPDSFSFGVTENDYKLYYFMNGQWNLKD